MILSLKNSRIGQVESFTMSHNKNQKPFCSIITDLIFSESITYCKTFFITCFVRTYFIICISGESDEDSEDEDNESIGK